MDILLVLNQLALYRLWGCHHWHLLLLLDEGLWMLHTWHAHLWLRIPEEHSLIGSRHLRETVSPGLRHLHLGKLLERLLLHSHAHHHLGRHLHHLLLHLVLEWVLLW